MGPRLDELNARTRDSRVPALATHEVDYRSEIVQFEVESGERRTFVALEKDLLEELENRARKSGVSAGARRVSTRSSRSSDSLSRK